MPVVVLNTDLEMLPCTRVVMVSSGDAVRDLQQAFHRRSGSGWSRICSVRPVGADFRGCDQIQPNRDAAKGVTHQCQSLAKAFV